MRLAEAATFTVVGLLVVVVMFTDVLKLAMAVVSMDAGLLVADAMFMGAGHRVEVAVFMAVKSLLIKMRAVRISAPFVNKGDI